MKFTNKFFLIVSFSLISLNSIAQTENLDDLVPFRKGNKWGIVHHDGSEFYKPVFDTIIPGSYRHYFSLFSYHPIEGNSVKVVLKGKPMWLLPNKTLKPEQVEIVENAVSFIEDYKATSINVKNSSLENKSITSNKKIDLSEKPKVIIEEKPVLVSSYNLINSKARVEKFRDSFFVYINDKMIPAFTSMYIKEIYSPKDSAVYLLLTDWNGKMGIANLTEGRLSVPFDYDELIANVANFIYAKKNGLNGIINAENQDLIPLKYKKLERIIMMNQKSSIYLAYDSRGFFFLELQGSVVIESTKIYEHLSGIRGRNPVFLAKKNKLFGIVTQLDSVLIPLKYKSINSYQDISRFVVLESPKDLYGFVDMENNYFRVEPIYAEISRPKEMKFEMNKKTRYLFLVSRNGQSFYVDNFGKEFISK